MGKKHLIPYCHGNVRGVHTEEWVTVPYLSILESIKIQLGSSRLNKEPNDAHTHLQVSTEERGSFHALLDTLKLATARF